VQQLVLVAIIPTNTSKAQARLPAVLVFGDAPDQVFGCCRCRSVASRDRRDPR
jgi:hypothetical protein